LHCPAERVARQSLQAFGEVVDSEQEQTQSTQERHRGRGIHRLRLDSSFSNVEQNDFKIFLVDTSKDYLLISLILVGLGSLRSLANLTSAKIPNTCELY
jgi:hypothetical protein